MGSNTPRPPASAPTSRPAPNRGIGGKRGASYQNPTKDNSPRASKHGGGRIKYNKKRKHKKSRKTNRRRKISKRSKRR